MSLPGRIGVNAAILGEQPTGLGLYAVNIISALEKLGERLIVYTSRPDMIRAPGAEVRATPAAVRPERGALGHLSRLLWTQTGLRRAVRRDRPAALLNAMPEGLLWPPVPQATVVHDLLPLHYPPEYPRQQSYFRYYVPAVLRHSRAVIVSSESTRQDILSFYRVPPEKVRVVLLGYDTGRFFPETHDRGAGREPYALFVGNVMPHKNLLRLVEAFAKSAEGTLVIRGSGHPAHVAALRERIAALGLGPRVDWQPYESEDGLVGLYRAARMLLLPSLYEGFGLPALEAMACGTPVVTSRTSSLPEVVGDAALLVDPLDTGALAAAITRLFADEGLARELRERGLARARLFSWEKTARAIQAVLAEVVARG